VASARIIDEHIKPPKAINCPVNRCAGCLFSDKVALVKVTVWPEAAGCLVSALRGTPRNDYFESVCHQPLGDGIANP
jgi:hypothetical protein